MYIINRFFAAVAICLVFTIIICVWTNGGRSKSYEHDKINFVSSCMDAKASYRQCMYRWKLELKLNEHG